MYTSEMIGDPEEVAGFEGNSAHPASLSSIICRAQGRNEPAGRPWGTTLTERVMGFLDRYNRPVHGHR
jgi:hypothetical protein